MLVMISVLNILNYCVFFFYCANTDLQGFRFKSNTLNSLMAWRADLISKSSKPITLAENVKLERLSEDECQERIKIHQEKAQRCLDAAQRVSLFCLLFSMSCLLLN